MHPFFIIVCQFNVRSSLFCSVFIHCTLSLRQSVIKLPDHKEENSLTAWNLSKIYKFPSAICVNITGGNNNVSYSNCLKVPKMSAHKNGTSHCCFVKKMNVPLYPQDVGKRICFANIFFTSHGRKLTIAYFGQSHWYSAALIWHRNNHTNAMNKALICQWASTCNRIEFTNKRA